MRQVVEQFVGNRQGRALALVALAILAAILLFAPTSSAQEGANNHLVGYVVAGLFVVVLVASLVVEVGMWPYTRANMRAERQVRAALRAGGALPIPPLPRKLTKVQKERQPDVENYTRQMIRIPWGERVSITGPELRPLFDQTVTFVRRVPGQWDKFVEPIQIFARMPAPWCYIGAAEVLQRLSFLRNADFSPVGLRQGLRFIALAQAVDPENVDALITRARILTSVSDPTWLRLAEDTLRRAQALAPNHPRLPGTEAVLFQRYGQHEKALACFEQAVARAPSSVDQVIARFSYADALLRMGRNEDAAAQYRALLQTETNDPWLWHNLSVALYRSQQYEEALACNQRALAIMQFNAALELGNLIRKKMAAQRPGGV